MSIVLGILFFGCRQQEEQPVKLSIRVKEAQTLKAAIPESDIVIEDFGFGVYYFSVTEKYLPMALSRFVGSHTNLELVSMVGDGNGGYGRDQGYTVVFKDKK